MPKKYFIISLLYLFLFLFLFFFFVVITLCLDPLFQALHGSLILLCVFWFSVVKQLRPQLTFGVPHAPAVTGHWRLLKRSTKKLETVFNVRKLDSCRALQTNTASIKKRSISVKCQI